MLLLDEPLSNLDAKLRVQVRRELRDLQRRLGLTTIFVTHDQEEANAVCDRIAVMNEGVVQQVGTPIELYERPANLFVASFLGTANILQGEIIGSGAERAYCVGKLRLPIPASASVPSGRAHGVPAAGRPHRRERPRHGGRIRDRRRAVSSSAPPCAM